MNWDRLLEIFHLNLLTPEEVALRIGLAAALGLAIGIDRGLKEKPVDFRVYIIVAVTACTMGVLAQEIYADYRSSEQTVNLDFTRVIEGVLTGIGFLGAGVIIRSREGERVVGTATGACIWASGALGITLGFGLYGLTLLAFVPIMVSLVVIGMLTGED